MSGDPYVLEVRSRATDEFMCEVALTEEMFTALLEAGLRQALLRLVEEQRK